MRTGQIGRRIAAAAVAAVLMAATPVPAYAEIGPSGRQGLPTAPSGDKLEYAAIADLIENYNKDYKNTKSGFVNASVNPELARSLSQEAAEVMDDARELHSSNMNQETKLLYESYKETARELRKEAQKINSTELPNAYKKGLGQMKSKLTKTVQGLVIQYGELNSQQELMNKQVQLAAEQAASVQRMKDAQLKSQTDVLAAQETLKQAENGAAKYQAGLQSLRQNILLLTGWDHDAAVEICPPPPADLNRIAAMDPQKDLTAAIGANYDLQTVRNGKAVGASDRAVKKRNIVQSEQDVASSLQSLYAAVIAKKQQYDAAQADYYAANQKMDAANRKNSLGMMGKLEYLNAETEYLTSKSAMETADMELFSAMETYDWAVKGLIVKGGGNER